MDSCRNQTGPNKARLIIYIYINMTLISPAEPPPPPCPNRVTERNTFLQRRTAASTQAKTLLSEENNSIQVVILAFITFICRPVSVILFLAVKGKRHLEEEGGGLGGCDPGLSSSDLQANVHWPLEDGNTLWQSWMFLLYNRLYNGLLQASCTRVYLHTHTHTHTITTATPWSHFKRNPYHTHIYVYIYTYICIYIIIIILSCIFPMNLVLPKRHYSKTSKCD